jgi:hypothetical protein
MLYLVEAHPTVERANVVDAGEGPGPVDCQDSGAVPSAGYLWQSVTPPSFHGGGDGGADVCPRLVRRRGAHVHSAHVARNLWRGDRQGEADNNAAEICFLKRLLT